MKNSIHSVLSVLSKLSNINFQFNYYGTLYIAGSSNV